ncbi:MAG TPA: SusC/RagA family TonB-linked outer membrane protein, partial [Sphingobacteriaceae bacterium]
MKLKLLAFLMLSIVTIAGAMAQSRTITGKVTAAEDGLPLPGVSVKVKGSAAGVSTGMDGNYSIVLPQGAKSLEFTYVGFLRQEVQVGAGGVVNVVLVTDAKQLSEVVVTALGMSKEKKSLGYAATQVGTEEINRTSPVSMLDGLQGKVAGVNISSQSGAPGASSKVILRGYSSVNGSNQPLYIIDGVPVDNTRFGATFTNRATDFGNNANDINPNDIESINILKGAAASNLYGSRAANGVILITTKKGRAGKLKIDFNSSATLSSVLMTPTLQNVYGQGWSGTFYSEENGSWGPRMDGKIREWGNTVDGVRLSKPFAPQEIGGFYDQGAEVNNSVSISGGNEKSTFYFSYGNVGSNGVVPGNADTYDRNSFSLRGSTTASAFSVAASLNYVNRNSAAVTAGQGTAVGSTTFQDLIQLPRDIRITDFKDYRNKFNNENNYFTPYAINPYFIINESGNDFNTERFFGNIDLNYKVLSWLSSSFKLGTDVSSSRLKEWTAINAAAPGSPNAGRAPDVGSVHEASYYRGELNADWVTNMNRKIGDRFAIDGMVGVNFNQRNSRDLAAQITGLTIPGFYALSNSSAPPVSASGYSKRRLVGAYAQASLAYNNFLYLTLNARNDWSSTLPVDRNSYFYPGASLSFVLTDAVNSLTNYGLSFAKFRASWGKTGNDADPYLVKSVLANGQVGLNFGFLNFPFGGVNGYEISDRIGNNTLSPELTTEYEFGTDLRFLNNRLGIDFSYYNKNTRDQIFTVPIAETSGYSSMVTNFGSIENKGVELALNGTPLKGKNFQW